ncbi:MAG: cytochrome c oxidase subunit 3 [Candidatus Sulfotelmatobacter sp.]
MASTVHHSPRIDAATIDAAKIDAAKIDRLPSSGNGGWGILVPPGGDRRVKPYSPPPASTGIWVGLAAITMTFAAFTSALIVRQGAAPDWQHFTLPPILYLNSLIIVASSVTLEISRRQISAFMAARTNNQNTAPSHYLYLTLGLGILFVAGQTFAWLQLRAQGLGIATNVSYSFFYVLTVAHALHLLGGLGGLVRVIGKLNHSVLRRSTLNATTLYWHFMGALWLYLLLLLWIKL